MLALANYGLIILSGNKEIKPGNDPGLIFFWGQSLCL